MSSKPRSASMGLWPDDDQIAPRLGRVLITGTPVRIVAVEQQRVADGERDYPVAARHDWRGRLKEDRP